MSPQFTLQRVCLECGGLADCVQALSDSYQGLPGGTEYQFACECGHHFTIESPGRVIFALLVAPLLGWLGVGRLMMAFDGPDKLHARFLVGCVFIAAALGMLVQQALRLRLRSRTRVA